MKTVLVVDDSAIIRKAIRRILEPLGFGVIEAESGVDALSRFESGLDVQAVLLDIEMPEMDGISFLRTLRSRHELPQPPVVICTTHNTFDKITEAIQAGANEYIMKPFTGDIVEEKLAGVGVAA